MYEIKHTYQSSQNEEHVKYIWNKVVPILLFSSSRQITVHPIRAPPGRFNNNGIFQEIIVSSSTEFESCWLKSKMLLFIN